MTSATGQPQGLVVGLPGIFWVQLPACGLFNSLLDEQGGALVGASDPW
jgi:hypothetical protein